MPHRLRHNETDGIAAAAMLQASHFECGLDFCQLPLGIFQVARVGAFVDDKPLQCDPGRRLVALGQQGNPEAVVHG